MNKYEFSHDGKTYKRINKTTAKCLYAAGETLYIQSCNLLPFSYWTHPAVINKERLENDLTTFDKFVNAFEYYNCINSETGKYAAFYIAAEAL